MKRLLSSHTIFIFIFASFVAGFSAILPVAHAEGTASVTNDIQVNSIEQVNPTALADGAFDHGWKFLVNLTVPSDEASIQLKFASWRHKNKVDSISPENDMRISSSEAPESGTVLIEGENTYSLPLAFTKDLDPLKPGRQVKVLVETGVPVDSLAGSYSTSFSVIGSHAKEVTGTLSAKGTLIRPTDPVIQSPFVGGLLERNENISFSLLKVFYGMLLVSMMLVSTGFAISRTTGRMV